MYRRDMVKGDVNTDYALFSYVRAFSLNVDPVSPFQFLI
jgi:hypothetical protein